MPPHFHRLILDALVSPAALFRMRGRTLGLFAVYVAACVAVLGAAAWLLIEYEGSVRAALLDYVFPESWHVPAAWIVDRFFATQQRAVLINALASGSIVLVSVLLFWLKEFVSASYESEGKLTSHPVREHPLWEQGWEELKLFAVYVAAQGTIFWIGYGSDPFLRGVALALSYAFLFSTFAVDFLSPVMQRHGGHYSRIAKTLMRHPMAALMFGALFSLPPIVAGRWSAANPEWSTTTAVLVLFSASLLAIAWAAIAGTWLAAKMLPTFLETRRSSVVSRTAAWSGLALVLAVNGYAFTAAGLSIHHKSQLLKLDYDVVLTSFSVETPRLRELLGNRAAGAISFDVDVHNPTPFDVAIEDNRIEVTHGGELIAESSLPRLAVSAGESVRAAVRMPLSMKPTLLAKGLDLVDLESYEVTLYLQVAPHFELPVYLID